MRTLSDKLLDPSWSYLHNDLQRFQYRMAIWLIPVQPILDL